jgi:hypothetical protein
MSHHEPHQKSKPQVRVALIHPWFLMKGGGDKVVDALAEMYPGAAWSPRHIYVNSLLSG